MKTEYEIYTDGGCDVHNTKKGSWSYVVIKDHTVIDQKGDTESNSTCNRMEMTAIKEALKYIESKSTGSYLIYSDSELCVKTLDEWAPRWKSFGWQRKKNGKGKSSAVKNLDIVKPTYELYEKLDNVDLEWVPGHSGVLGNELADQICQNLLKG